MYDFFLKLYSIFLHTYTYQVLVTIVELTVQLGPFILASVFIHVLLVQYFPIDKIRFTSANKAVSIVVAALLGVISPFPTYVAVPIGLSFLATGVPLAAIFAFMVASPLINPSIFFLTFTQLGAPLAFARILAAFVLAVMAGWLSTIFLTKVKPVDHFQRKSKRPFWVEFYHSLRFFGKYFLISIVISALVKSLLPVDFIEKLFNSTTSFGLLLALALGIPFYSCGGAAIPIIQVLQEMGMGSGAALTFFIAGPATKLETIYIYKSLLGFRVLFFYLLITLAGALLFGFLMSTMALQ